ncbi:MULTISPECIES: HDOD domain-containing protein [Dissulfurimicrobium]|nr:HDOD domain-containing protein [Dissulfurimicrobium hydrothermale]UKL13394.1 HDOD domain-containing protein [Dissulfurimicrobium hydrothermale]
MARSCRQILTIDWAGEDLPTLPSVVHKLLAVASDDKKKISDLADIISRDPTMAIRVLKVVNNAFYSIGVEVTSIKHAISLLGFKEIVRITFGVVMSERFLTVAPEVRLYAEALWRHLIATAVIAQDLAPDGGEEADLYTLGLLHDIGWLVLMAQAPMVMIRLAEEEGTTRQEAEWLWGVDHQLWGARLAERWGLPEPFQIVALRHHDPFLELDPPDYLVRIALADYLVHYMGATVVNKPEKEIDPMVLGRLAICDDAFDEIKKSVKAKARGIEDLWRSMSS